MDVRDFAPDDFEAAYRLDQACYPRLMAYSRFALREFLSAPGARAWTAEEDSTLVGFVIVQKLGGRRGHVITLDVREDLRRRGVGRRLLAQAEAWLKGEGVRRIHLETAVENAGGVAFWKAAGYRIVGSQPGYYADRWDAYAMEKEL